SATRTQTASVTTAPDTENGTTCVEVITGTTYDTAAHGTSQNDVPGRRCAPIQAKIRMNRAPYERGGSSSVAWAVPTMPNAGTRSTRSDAQPQRVHGSTTTSPAQSRA